MHAEALYYITWWSVPRIFGILRSYQTNRNQDGGWKKKVGAFFPKELKRLPFGSMYSFLIDRQFQAFKPLRLPCCKGAKFFCGVQSYKAFCLLKGSFTGLQFTFFQHGEFLRGTEYSVWNIKFLWTWSKNATNPWPTSPANADTLSKRFYITHRRVIAVANNCITYQLVRIPSPFRRNKGKNEETKITKQQKLFIPTKRCFIISFQGRNNRNHFWT